MLFLAIRHLTHKKRQTVLTIFGILLGSAAYVAISGMMIGFQSFIIDQLVNNDAHVRISAREEPIEAHSLDQEFFPNAAGIDWLVPPSGRRDDTYIQYAHGWFERLDKDPDVLAYSPQLKSQVIFTRGNLSQTAQLIGSDPNRQTQVSNIERYMTSGKFNDIGESGNRLAMGSGLLERLGARVGETILVATGKSEGVPFRIVSSFQLGVHTLDDSTAFGALADVQKVSHMPSRVSDIAIRLVDVSRATEVATRWSIGSNDKIQSWEQSNEGIMSVFKTQNIVRNSMTISILIVAGFGIYNILSMSVAHKRKEIAILRSIGYEPKDISRLFLTQGLILGFLGGLSGLAIGFLVCKYMSTIQISAQRTIGTGKMFVSFDYLIYVRAFILAFLSSSAAAYLPARAAGKLEPIEIIRSEGS